ncbi:DAZ-associated protein 1 Deleted in azoospermia-associated protein 1 [Channa argus]|uniref:DAZ-associated protein 1 Deleted in azoospermia-associated protein 1 n=1 Tax=Channa argus TaxID=215402 RepID=A0A6G1PKC3_CHAAH|nr:DAZ-associated protein 1 Deleted in azoospermia-associated protein 1 [Channa argus]
MNNNLVGDEIGGYTDLICFNSYINQILINFLAGWTVVQWKLRLSVQGCNEHPSSTVRMPAAEQPLSPLRSDGEILEALAGKAGAGGRRKLFVGGLDWSTTQETLRSYFSQYGEVVDCVIMKDKTTNQSRGFGFVKFKDPNCVRTVLETKPHNLDGRNKGSKGDSNKSKKIFVGGIPHNCGEPELRDYFNRFGVVTEVVMIYDAEKQRPRGFGFITFEAEQSVDQAVNMHFHDIMGKKVEVKKAEPRDSKAPGQLGPGQWAPRGILSAANGWTAQPAQGWQQPYGPQGGYGPPLSAGRGTPTQPPSPFNAFLVTTPAGSFAAPQGYPHQGYTTAPQFGYSFGTPHADQYAQQVPPPPTTPGTAPLGFAPATTPTQDLSKAPTGQPDFPYSQYGLGNYPQDPSAYGPTRPSHSYGQDEQGGYSAGYGQDLTAFGHSFADPSQPTASYGAPTAQPATAPQPATSAFGRGQNHNVQGFHPYRR